MSLPDLSKNSARKLFGDTARASAGSAWCCWFCWPSRPPRTFFADWQRYQRGYERLISKRSDAFTLAPPL